MKLNLKNESLAFGTNILDVEVPKQLRNKVATKLDYFDGVLGGEGLTPSSVILFTGTPGAGKTTMTLKLADSLTRNGAVVVFNTAEESLFQVKLVVERLGLRTGFAVGQETHVPTLLAKCDALRNKRGNKGKPFVLIVDSLQCMDDGKYNGNTNSKTAERVLGQITDYCKENFTNAIVIGQVIKSGKMAGTQKLKHMIDAMVELSVEEKDEDLLGCRVLRSTKNRFGGCGHTFYLDLNRTGFKTVAKVSAS